MRFPLNRAFRFRAAPALCAGLLLLCLSCNASEKKLPSVLPGDADYFIALTELRANQIEPAKKRLEAASRNATPLVARRSMEALARLLDVQERIGLLMRLIERFSDDEAYLFATKELFAQGEFQKLITITDNIENSACAPEVISYRFFAMDKKGDSRLRGELYEWIANNAYSQAHYSFYTHFPEILKDDEVRNSAYKLRASVFIRDYEFALSCAKDALSAFREKRLVLTPYLLSDIGKAYLFSDNKHSESAEIFRRIAEDSSNSSALRFYAAFYAGRLFSKAPDERQNALKWLKHAMEFAPREENYDNALWYYLAVSLDDSVESAVEAAKAYISTWNDAEYFDDFLDNLSVQLLNKRAWQSYYDIYKAIDGFATNASTAKFAYVSGRLLEHGVVNAVLSKEERMQLANNAFTRACRSDYGGSYYRIMAARKLSLNEKEVFHLPKNESFVPDENAERLLEGYAYYDLPEFIYPEWQKLRDSIGLKTASLLANFLKERDQPDNNYQVQSLRIAAAAMSREQGPYNEFSFRLLYPQNFMEDVEKACSQFSVPEYEMLAVMRTESFFDPNVKSVAGAQGLTQLMQPTAVEIAGRLKMKEFDLADSATNILFGTFYLDDITKRLGGSRILAVFAYNCGISRLRNWVKSAKIDFAQEFGDSYGRIPMDIFLEIIPYTETRDYGRKVLTAATFYGKLYYGKTSAEIVREFME